MSADLRLTREQIAPDRDADKVLDHHADALADIDRKRHLASWLRHQAREADEQADLAERQLGNFIRMVTTERQS